MKTFERIRDPIHNIIEFNVSDDFEKMLWTLIQQPEFQRLRRIKQLGFSDFVYPGAGHSRFAHSVGTFHTARQLMVIVRKYESEFKERAARVALAACLCHDLGHGPLSHAFHSVIEASNLDFHEHELVSRDLVLSLEPILNTVDGAFARDVAHLIERTASPGRPPQTIYDAVVSSQFDADRLDYMRRDRFMAGSLHGVIDYDWLLANIEIEKVLVSEEPGEVTKVPTFVVGRKALHAAEAYILALFQLYPTIYFHKATRGAEVVFIELMRLVIENVRKAPRGRGVLPDEHPISVFACKPDLSSYKELDDNVCWGSFWQLRRSGETRIADLASRLLERRLLKCFDARDIIHRKLRDAANRKEREEYTDAALKSLRQRVDAYRQITKKLVLYDRYERSPYHKFVSGRSALNQIMARDSSGRIYDLAELSTAVASVQNFKVDRYYYDRDDTECGAALESLVDEAMKHPPARE